MTDSQIVDLYWSRDSQAIVLSNEQYGTYCRQIAWNVLYNKEDCDECLNETWYRAWISMPDARPDCLKAFLGKITRHLALDSYRKSHARKRGNGQIPLVYEELRECLSGPEELLETKLLEESINQFLKSLDQTARILFVRRYWYLDSLSDAARFVHISESSAKSMLFRTRKKLKAHLEKEGFTL